MSSSPKRFLALRWIPACAGMSAFLLLLLSNATTYAGGPGYFGYGKLATPAEIAGWDIDVHGQDGVGLPDGKGTVDHGADVFAQQCAACHGTFGEGEGRYPKLMGGEGTLTGDRPEPSVGSYWPYAPTLFDYINRAMPFSAPHTLSADDVYAVVAYILNFNNIVPSQFRRRSRQSAQGENAEPRQLHLEGPASRHRSQGMHERLHRSQGCENYLFRRGQGPDASNHGSARHDDGEITQ